MKIPYRGNLTRFAGQSSARLLSAESALSKQLPRALQDHCGVTPPRGHCIVLVYLGNLGVPFVDLCKYTITALDKLKAAIGQAVDIGTFSEQLVQPSEELQGALELDETPQPK